MHLSLDKSWSLWRDTQRQVVRLSLANGNPNKSINPSSHSLYRGAHRGLVKWYSHSHSHGTIYSVLFTIHVCLWTVWGNCTYNYGSNYVYNPKLPQGYWCISVFIRKQHWCKQLSFFSPDNQPTALSTTNHKCALVLIEVIRFVSEDN